MVDQIIRPSLLPDRPNPVASEKVPVDNGATVGGATIESLVLSGRPSASQSEAEAGTDPTKAMTPLTTKQAIIAQGDARFATVAQGALADTAVQPADLAAVATSGEYADLLDAPPALTDGDKGDITVSGGGTVWNIDTGVVDAARVSDDPFEWEAINEKLMILNKTDKTLYVDGATGVDAYGRGAVGLPFKTPQGAYDFGVPFGGLSRYEIIVEDGDVTESYRPAASLDRAALLYIDRNKFGRRTDAPGGVMTGSLVVRAANPGGAVFKPGSANGYTRGIYVTGHVGSVGFQNFKIEGQVGTEALFVGHRGSYCHLSDIELDGASNTTFGVIAEAGAYIEGLTLNIHHCVIGVQAYQASTAQLSLSSNIHDCSSLGINIPSGGYVGLTTGSICSSNIIMQAGGKFDCTGISGSRVTISGALNLRGGAWTAAFTDVTGTITTYPGLECNLGAFGWSNAWTDYGAAIYAPGAKSYVAPATQSTVATPIAFLGGERNLYADTTFQIVNNSGAEISESIGGSAISIPGNNQAMPSNVRGLVNVANLTATANRTGITLPSGMVGRSPTAPIPAGTVLYVMGNSSFTIGLVPGAIADFNLGAVSIPIGTSSGSYIGVVAVMGSTGLWRVSPLGALRP